MFTENPFFLKWVCGFWSLKGVQSISGAEMSLLFPLKRRTFHQWLTDAADGPTGPCLTKFPPRHPTVFVDANETPPQTGQRCKGLRAHPDDRFSSRDWIYSLQLHLQMYWLWKSEEKRVKCMMFALTRLCWNFSSTTWQQKYRSEISGKNSSLDFCTSTKTPLYNAFVQNLIPAWCGISWEQILSIGWWERDSQTIRDSCMGGCFWVVYLLAWFDRLVASPTTTPAQMWTIICATRKTLLLDESSNKEQNIFGAQRTMETWTTWIQSDEFSQMNSVAPTFSCLKYLFAGVPWRGCVENQMRFVDSSLCWRQRKVQSKVVIC